ncbi:MAG: ferredoxin--NADP reductase [Pseudomonadota bacterium]
MAKWLTGKVVENTRVNERLTALKFEAPLETFKAGQFVRIGLEIDGETVARPYSLVNPPQDPVFEVYFNIVPEGPLSPKLFDLAAGDELLVGPLANGFLVVDEIPECRDLWMVATGTGVGPFLSILQTDDAWPRFENIVLCYSVRAADELAYRELTASISAAHPEQFKFVPFVTREKVEGAFAQRVPLCIEDGSLEARLGLTLSPEHSHVMMCGSAEMIADVSAQLESREMQRHRRRDPGHFTMEKYH